MKLLVPTNWQSDLIPAIKSDSVVELYGKLAADFVGGARAPYILPHISKKHAKIHIQQAHQNNIQFNYVLNATCMDNLEFTSFGQKKLHELFSWLSEIGTDSVTVTIPYLLQWIKKNYPHFELHVSSLAGIDCIQRAKYWQDLGADVITLASHKVNRNFTLLRQIRKNVNCQLQLILNNLCFLDCPTYNFHQGLASHASQLCHPLGGFSIDYYFLSCRYRMFLNPAEIIKSNWIRPEDMHYYEEIGIDRMKIVGRSDSTETILLRVNAYSNRHYNSNLMDLLTSASINRGSIKFRIFHGVKYFFRPFLVNIFKLAKILELTPLMDIYIENILLGDFLKYFLEGRCTISCQNCNYCEEVTKRVIKIDPDYQYKIKKKYEDLLQLVTRGEVFKYKYENIID